jgi:hypothetical protein
MDFVDHAFLRKAHAHLSSDYCDRSGFYLPNIRRMLMLDTSAQPVLTLLVRYFLHHMTVMLHDTAQVLTRFPAKDTS